MSSNCILHNLGATTSCCIFEPVFARDWFCGLNLNRTLDENLLTLCFSVPIQSRGFWPLRLREWRGQPGGRPRADDHSHLHIYLPDPSGGQGRHGEAALHGGPAGGVRHAVEEAVWHCDGGRSNYWQGEQLVVNEYKYTSLRTWSPRNSIR